MSQLTSTATPGRGGQSTLSLVQYYKKKAVIKRFLSRGAYENELGIIKDLGNQYIVRFYNAEECTDSIVMEYLEGGTLSDAIPALEWTSKRRIARQVALGLAYIHSKNILHCDIKSANILLTGHEDAKICDFGCARKIGEGGREGTLPWMAPETLLDLPQYSPKSDVYALGMLIWEMASGGTQPYEGHTRDCIVRLISRGCTEVIPKVTPEKYAKEIRRCWEYNPEKRPEAKEVLSADQEKSDNDADDDCLGLDEEYGEDRIPMHIWKAAKQGGCFAQAKVGWMYFNGTEETPLNYEKALHWYQQAAEGGHPISQKNIGVMHQMGLGTPQDDTKAAYWFKRAANLGDIDCQNAVGEMNQYGHGIPEDHVKALDWYQRAAKQGHIAAHHHVGDIYFIGKDIPRDSVKAMEWYQRAAEMGEARSQRMLSWMSFKGEGVPENREKAIEWFRLAMEPRTDPPTDWTLHPDVEVVLEGHQEVFEWLQKAIGPLVTEDHKQ